MEKQQNTSNRLALYQKFPSPTNSDYHFWKGLIVMEVEIEEINFLFVTSCIESRKRSIEANRGRYYFIVPLWTLKKGSEEEWQERYKALIEFNPSENSAAKIRFNIIHPEFKDEYDPSKAYLKTAFDSGLVNYSRIPPQDVNPDLISEIKNEIITAFQNMPQLQRAEEKRYKKRAYFPIGKGRLYIAIVPVDYVYPPI